jgi:replicative DNA helicase
MNREINRDMLVALIKEQEPSFLQAARRTGYVCPVCGNGTGADGDGLAKDKDKPYYKCFKCDLYGDVLELYAKEYGLDINTDFREIVDRAAAFYGFPVPEYQNQPENERYTQSNIHTSVYTHQQTEKEREPEVDYLLFYREAQSDLDKTDYLKRRGISQEVAERFMIGYVYAWRHPKAPNSPASPRLIIPTSRYSYLARDTRQDIPEEQRKYRISKVGSVRIFNAKALREAKRPIFIVEGEIDALSVIEAGGEAIATGSASNIRRLLNLLEENRPTQPLIVAMDNDKAGEDAAQELIDGLRRLSLSSYRVNPYGSYKDANEALTANREEFIAAIAKAERLEGLEDTLEIDRENYLRKSTLHYLQGFIDGIKASVDTPYIPTGFFTLDQALDGGLYEGLYVMGAISGLGKTTLVTQIADQIAEAGQDVLIISLEMARSELMAKSISRHTAIEILENGGSMQHAKTTRGITTGKRYLLYNDAERELIRKAIEEYKTYADRLYIIEGVGDIGALQVREAVERHKVYTGNSPVVIVDYLQILAPYNDRATDKQNTDKAVLELKRISRDFKTPVIAISSFNRENYKVAVSMRAFKESGAVEYSSDVLIGLQLEGAGNTLKSEEDIQAALQRDPREIELVILKNRNGKVGVKVPFDYRPMFNYFEEAALVTCRGEANAMHPYST